MQVKINRKVPVEPGVELATDVYLPHGPGPFPVVLVRTCYSRAKSIATARKFVARGFGFVVQDVRGKYDSDGVFTPLVHEVADGHATIDWVANQPWCNGRIGMWGLSYLGMVQVPAAAAGHEALRCIAPSVAPASFFTDWIRYDGCYAHANTLLWGLAKASCPTEPAQQHFDWSDLYQLQDLDSISTMSGLDVSMLRTWAEHDRYDTYWQGVDQHPMHAYVRVPGFHWGGWFDHVSRGQIEAYTNIQRKGATEEARTGQRLLLGPWGHKTHGQSAYGDWELGPEAAVSPLLHEMRFFDFYLKDIDTTGFSSTEPVRIFMMGENRWRSFIDWPPPETVPQEWYLDSSGDAATGTGGVIAPDRPSQDREDSYTYDPNDPVPTRGGPIFWGLEPHGPIDQRPIMGRSDVVCYRSHELAEQLAVAGEVRLDLVISSTSEDTDLIAKLCVQEPAGQVTCLTLGSLRCRYRGSFADPQPLTPGEPTPIHIRLFPTAYVFSPKSRIVLLLTSSDFPRINAHPNTMAPPFRNGKPRIAQITIHHGPSTQTKLHLPTIPN